MRLSATRSFKQNKYKFKTCFIGELISIVIDYSKIQ